MNYIYIYYISYKESRLVRIHKANVKNINASDGTIDFVQSSIILKSNDRIFLQSKLLN